MKITDENEIATLREKYLKLYEKYDASVYNSRYSESSRLVRLTRIVKIKRPIELVFHELATMLAKDMHSDLEYVDLSSDTFYRASGKNNKRDMRLSKFDPSFEMELEFFTEEAQIIKNFRFKSRKKNTVTKIIYQDLARGVKAWTGPMDSILRNDWIRAEILRFDIQFFSLKHNLNVLTASQEESYKLKLAIMQKKLRNRRQFSK